MSQDKEIIVAISSRDEALDAIKHGASALFCNPSTLPDELRGRVRVYSEETNVRRVKLRSPDDIEVIARMASSGVESILVESGDLKIIPLENLVARLQGADIKLLTEISSIEEAEAMLGVLERGVDGVVFRPREMRELELLKEMLSHIRQVELRSAKVIDVFSAGMGERACVDTTSMLRMGEGMLVGSMSRMLFLIHGETIGSKFTAPRPFRVNAGAVHMYTLTPSGKTTYLSELSAGKRVLISLPNGSARVATVGRVKIERRPLVMVEAEVGDVRGSAILQNAETIRLVTGKGEPIEVTSLARGDEVLVLASSRAKGRHLGMEVDEYIDEV